MCNCSIKPDTWEGNHLKGIRWSSKSAKVSFINDCLEKSTFHIVSISDLAKKKSPVDLEHACFWGKTVEPKFLCALT